MMTGRRHDFRCDLCDTVYRNQHLPFELSAMTAMLFCRVCGSLLVWIPNVGRIDAKGPFQAFDITVRDPRTGGNQQIHIDSLHKLRQVEQESEQRARNGEGAPLVWRDYAQDQSNRDVHTLGVDPSLAAKEQIDRARKAGTVGMKELFAGEDHAPELGPGAIPTATGLDRLEDSQ